MTDPDRVGEWLFTGDGAAGMSNVDPLHEWNAQEAYWRANWANRPYVAGDRDFEYYRPGYRYGVESAHRHRGLDWSEVETDLQVAWDRYEHRGLRSWEEVKHAVRDAFERIAHR